MRPPESVEEVAPALRRLDDGGDVEVAEVVFEELGDGTGHGWRGESSAFEVGAAVHPLAVELKVLNYFRGK